MLKEAEETERRQSRLRREGMTPQNLLQLAVAAARIQPPMILGSGKHSVQAPCPPMRPDRSPFQDPAGRVPTFGEGQERHEKVIILCTSPIPPLAASPSRKAVARLRERIRAILRPNPIPWERLVSRVNSVLRGWADYFSYGTVSRAYWWVDTFILHRARGFLTHRHKVPGQGTRRFTQEMVFGPGGLLCLAQYHRARASHAMA
jgi:RNA-directed DNA polymerase